MKSIFCQEWRNGKFFKRSSSMALKSIEQGLARIKPSRQELHKRAVAIIQNARESVKLLMKEGLIKQSLPEEELLEQ